MSIAPVRPKCAPAAVPTHPKTKYAQEYGHTFSRRNPRMGEGDPSIISQNFKKKKKQQVSGKIFYRARLVYVSVIRDEFLTVMIVEFDYDELCRVFFA